MIKTFSVGLFFAIVSVVAAEAQTCVSLPYSLANGTTADADQVMANFSAVMSCASAAAPINGPLFTGNVGIGVLSAPNLLTIDGNALGAAVSINNSGTGSGKDGLFVHAASGNTDYVLHLTGSSNKEVFYAASDSGNVGIGTMTPSLLLYVNGTAGGTSAWSNTSDARLKKNIVPISDALALIEQLQGVRFDWRNPDERTVGRSLKLPVSEAQVGFIAQDVRKVLPEAVSVSSDDQKLMSVSESKVVPVLVEAVKQLAAINQKQTAEIQNLKQRVGDLERKSERRTAKTTDRLFQ